MGQRSGPNFVWTKWAWAKKARVRFWTSFLGLVRPKNMGFWAGPLTSSFFTALIVCIWFRIPYCKVVSK
ncbi:transmembrane protein, putative [Medicago truncatula]|uniref:Transmembrane protein, putative n=1 Tax=Medicago truncatula TaxID=3880 RepID=G7JE74_MEDTR|nr:transmembrane protein, putative [Medicago truncatula]